LVIAHATAVYGDTYLALVAGLPSIIHPTMRLATLFTTSLPATPWMIKGLFCG
jgi:hypothetical protein